MMRTIHALLTAPALALALGASPAGAATLPTADEAQKIVSQAVNARAATTVVCSANKQNILSKALVDRLRDLAYGRVTYDVTQFYFSRAGERWVAKEQGDWEKARLAVDPDKAAFAKLSSASDGCWRIPLAFYTVGTVSNVRAGEDAQSALADYTFTVAPSVFADGMLKIDKHADPMVTADSLVNVPARPVFLSYFVDNLNKPFTAQAKLKLDGGVWHVVP